MLSSLISVILYFTQGLLLVGSILVCVLLLYNFKIEVLTPSGQKFQGVVTFVIAASCMGVVANEMNFSHSLYLVWRISGSFTIQFWMKRKFFFLGQPSLPVEFNSALFTALLLREKILLPDWRLDRDVPGTNQRHRQGHEECKGGQCQRAPACCIRTGQSCSHRG